jgi:hypothetical protein
MSFQIPESDPTDGTPENEMKCIGKLTTAAAVTTLGDSFFFFGINTKPDREHLITKNVQVMDMLLRTSHIQQMGAQAYHRPIGVVGDPYVVLRDPAEGGSAADAAPALEFYHQVKDFYQTVLICDFDRCCILLHGLGMAVCTAAERCQERSVQDAGGDLRAALLSKVLESVAGVVGELSGGAPGGVDLQEAAGKVPGMHWKSQDGSPKKVVDPQASIENLLRQWGANEA